MNDSRRELLKKDETLTIKTALICCRAYEASEAHMKVFAKVGSNASVDIIEKRDDRSSSSHQDRVTDCKFCGRDHVYGRCPAFKSRC